MITPPDTIHVLHVDDEPDFASTVAPFLEREDERISVRTATSAADGMAVLADHDVDCVVSDYDMPVRTGIDFLESVRETHPDLPFLLYTGKGSEEIASEAISAGVTDYLQKGSGTDQYELLANRIVNCVERTRAQRERRRHLDAIETAQEGIGILDEDERYVYVNDAYADLYGYEPEEMLGEGWELVYRDEDVREIREEVLPAVEATGRWQGETTGLRADGSTFPEDHTLAKTDEGELVCTVRDVTDRKEYESRIEGLHRATRRLIAAETEREVAERTTEAAHEILGYPNNVVRLLDEEDRRLHPVAISEGLKEALSPDRPAYEVGQPTAGLAFEKGETIIYEDLRELDDDITHTPGGSMYVPIGDDGVLTVSATRPDAFDESDVNVAEILAANAEAALGRVAQTQRLRRRNEHLEEVVDLVAHDLRNPLEVATGRLALAETTGESAHLDAVGRAHSRMEELIEDLLTLAREGTRATDLDAVALAETVEACWRTIATDDATLVVETDRTVRADRGRLRRLLDNLLENAVRHGGEGVTITVGDFDGGFYVADDGPGMPADERDRAFESGYSTAAEGTGFGLLIVKRMAEAHGWDVSATGSADGGARFEVAVDEFVTG